MRTFPFRESSFFRFHLHFILGETLCKFTGLAKAKKVPANQHHYWRHFKMSKKNEEENSIVSLLIH